MRKKANPAASATDYVDPRRDGAGSGPGKRLQRNPLADRGKVSTFPWSMIVTLIAVQSLDGFITRHEEAGTAFASEADQQFFRSALRACDASVMGSATYRQSREEIRSNLYAERLRVVMTRDPGRYAGEGVAGQLEFSAASPAEIVASLRQRGRQRCALLGGGQVYGAFLAADLVDELWLTIEARIFGTGTKLATGRLNNRFVPIGIERLGPETLLVRCRRAEAPR
jgi:dihydrofolate reductase